MIDRRVLASEAFATWLRTVRSGNVSHAYLLLGADTAVRGLFADRMAAAVLCPDYGCGVCASCRAITGHCYPDVKYYNSDGKMKVDDAEKLIEDTYVKGMNGHKFYFVDRAESLSPAVQNKLLKVFEDPSPNVTIVLEATGESGILPTVLSRAKRLYLPRFSVEEIKAELIEEGHPDGKAEIAAILSDGRFDRAFRYLEDERYEALYREAFEVLTNCKKSSDIAAFLDSPLFAKDQLPTALELFEIILRDCLAYLSGDTRFTTVNRDYYIRQIAAGFSPGGAAMAILALAKARKMLTFNVGAVTVAETALFDILEAKYKWR